MWIPIRTWIWIHACGPGRPTTPQLAWWHLIGLDARQLLCPAMQPQVLVAWAWAFPIPLSTRVRAMSWGCLDPASKYPNMKADTWRMLLWELISDYLSVPLKEGFHRKRAHSKNVDHARLASIILNLHTECCHHSSESFFFFFKLLIMECSAIVATSSPFLWMIQWF